MPGSEKHAAHRSRSTGRSFFIISQAAFALLSLFAVGLDAQSGPLRVERRLVIKDAPIDATPVGSSYQVIVSQRGDAAFQSGTGPDVAISVVDSVGGILARFGRSGAGPGEFRLPEPIAFIGDSIVIFDLALHRFSVWSRKGVLLREVTATIGVAPVLVAGRFAYGVRVGATGVEAIVRWAWETNKGLSTILDRSNAEFDAMFPRTAPGTTYSRPVLGLSAGRIVVGNAQTFSFLRPGATPLHIKFDRKPVFPSKARIDRIVDKAVNQSRGPLPKPDPASLRSGLSKVQQPFFSYLSPLYVDDTGNIWTMSIAGDSAEVLVVEQEGQPKTAAIGCPGFMGRWSRAGDWLVVMCDNDSPSSDTDAIMQLYRVSYPNK